MPVIRNRGRTSRGRPHTVNVRFTDEELRDVAAAAARAGLRRTGYVGEAAVAAARAYVAGGEAGATRAELATVQREVFAARAAVVRAVQAAAGTSEDLAVAEVEIGAVAVERLDAVAERLGL